MNVQCLDFLKNYRINHKTPCSHLTLMVAVTDRGGMSAIIVVHVISALLYEVGTSDVVQMYFPVRERVHKPEIQNIEIL